MLKSTSLCEQVNHGLAVEQNEFSFFWLNVCNQNESRLEKLWLKNIYCTTNVDLHIPLLISILIFMSFSFQFTVHGTNALCIFTFKFWIYMNWAWLSCTACWFCAFLVAMFWRLICTLANGLCRIHFVWFWCYTWMLKGRAFLSMSSKHFLSGKLILI